MKSGEDNPNSELTKREVARLREFHNRGKSVKWLAEEFELSESAVRKIVNGKTWRPNRTAQLTKLPISTRILQVLNDLDTDETIRKVDIAEAVNCTVGSASIPLAGLTRAKLAYQYMGNYRITGKGTRILKEDPTMIQFEIDMAAKAPSRVSISIDLSHVEHCVICKEAIIEESGLTKEQAHWFLPYVFLYMKANGDKLPAVKFGEMIHYDEVLMRATEAFQKVLLELE